jgi:hypothetical protein
MGISKRWSIRTGYIPVPGTRTVLVCYASIRTHVYLDDLRWWIWKKKIYWQLKTLLKIFWFFNYISIISLTFNENSWDGGSKEVNLQRMGIIIHLKNNFSNILLTYPYFKFSKNIVFRTSTRTWYRYRIHT